MANKEKIENPETEKVAINFYIRGDTLEKIEDFLFMVKKRLPIYQRRKLSRSIFYEICLRVAMEDFNKKGEESSLWKAIQDSVTKT